MNFGSFAFSHSLPDPVKRNIRCRMGKHPAASACGLRSNQPEAAQLGQQTPDHHGIGADAGGNVFGGQALFRCRCQQTEHMHRE